MRRMLGCYLMLLSLAMAAIGQGTEQLQKKIVGAWRLVSVEGELPGMTGFYDHPTGLMVYDASGTMSVQIANRGARKKFARGLTAGTEEEKAEAFSTYFSYYGTFTVDAVAGTVTHHIEDSSYPDLRGRKEMRWLELQGEDRIVLMPLEDGNGGTVARKDVTYRLVWERVR